MNDDAALLRRYVDDRLEESFAELVRRHVDLVYATALRRTGGDAHRAEDVAQQVFTELARHARRLSHHPALGAWLYTSTRNAAINLMVAEQRRRQREQEAYAMSELTAAPAPDPDWERLRPVLDDAMDQLGEADRTAVFLRFFEKRSFADVGRALRLTEDAARMRVDRALDKLHALLAERGITSSSAALTAVFANQVVAAAPAGLATSITGAALTGAAAAEVGALATVIAFMTATKTTVVLGIAAVLTVTTAFYQSNRARTAAAQFAAADKEHAAARARLAELETKARAAEHALTEREKAATQLASPKPLATAPVAEADAATQQKALQQFLDNNPVLQGLQMEATRADQRRIMEPLYRSCGFSSEQIEQALEHRYQIQAWRKAQFAAGLKPPYGVGYDRFRAMFGDAATERLIEYDKGLGDAIGGLDGALCYKDEPLTADQRKRLIEITERTKTAVARDAPSLARYDWNRILVEAEPILSPVQSQVLRAQAANVRMQMQYAAAAKEAAAAAKK